MLNPNYQQTPYDNTKYIQMTEIGSFQEDNEPETQSHIRADLLDIDTFCAGVKKQRPPLIRLETVAPSTVKRLILAAYSLFLFCVILAAIKLPTVKTTTPLNGFCGSATNPIPCNKNAKQFISRVYIPSDSENFRLIIKPEIKGDDLSYYETKLKYSIRVSRTLENDMEEFATAMSPKPFNIKCNGKNPCESQKSELLPFELPYFAVQMESQYNFLALAPEKTDCMVYIIFDSKDSSPFEHFPGLSFELEFVQNWYAIRAIISLLMSITLFMSMTHWFHTIRNYKPAKHLPQRDWISMANLALLLYSNPVYAVVDLIYFWNDSVLSQGWHFAFQTIELIGYMIIMLWLLMMSTGIAATDRLPIGFYFKKISFLSFLGYIYFVFGFLFAFQPSAYKLSGIKGSWVAVMLILQVALYVFIIYRTFRTWKKLRNRPYSLTRFAQLSFRVFLLLGTLLLLSMILQFGIMLISFTSGKSLSNVSESSFSLVGRKLYMHGIVLIMTFCYLNPTNHTGNDKQPEDSTQYVVYERNLHQSRIISTRTGIVNQTTTDMYNQVYGIWRFAEHVLHSSSSVNDNDVKHASTLMGKVFCIETAVKLLNLSVTAYYDPEEHPELTDSSCGRQMEDIPSIYEQGYQWMEYIQDKKTDTHVYIIGTHDRIIVSFRGTNSKTNIKTDLQVKQIPYTFNDGLDRLWEHQKARVHKGFSIAYNSVREPLLKVLSNRLEDHPVAVYCTGHSLGGALATLCAIDVADRLNVKEEYGVEIYLYNFGCPRVGNHSFARHFNRLVLNAFRVACDGDIVAGLPKVDVTRLGRRFFGTYKHVGIEVVIDPEGLGNMIVDPNFVEKKFSMRFKGSQKSHLIRTYMKGFQGLYKISDNDNSMDEV